MKMFVAVLLFALLLVPCAFADNPHNAPRGPVIVAEQDFLNQTDWLPATTIFTPAADGLFRVSFYEEVTLGNPSNCFPSPTYAWVDASGQQSTNGGQQTFARSDSTIHAKANTPITITIAPNCGTAAPAPYNLFVVIEQL
jgi:hypothetical protein